MTVNLLAAGNGPWLPHAMGEVLWGTLAFLIVAAILAKFGVPAIKKASQERTAKIAEELAAADRAKAAAEANAQSVRAALADAESESAMILADARATADRVRADLVAKGHSEAETIRQRGMADLASLATQGSSDVAGEVRRLAVGAAERIIVETLDESSQQQLIDSYIAQVANSN